MIIFNEDPSDWYKLLHRTLIMSIAMRQLIVKHSLATIVKIRTVSKNNVKEN